MTTVRSPEQPAPLWPVVAGFLLAGSLLLGLGFWVAYRTPAPSGPPSLELIQPAGDTSVRGPLHVTFRTGRPLALHPTGWGAGRYHLHMLLDSSELMPAAADIRALGANRYTWRVAKPAQTVRLQLIWSLPNHSRVPTGASRAVRVTVE